MKKTKSIIEKSLVLFSILLIAWFIISWAEVVTHNMDEHPTYNKYNMFVLMTENQN